MIARIALVAAIAVASIAASSDGPSEKKFTKLRTAQGETCPPIRNLSCKTLGDPSEYKCTWDEKFAGKKWRTSTALVGRDGKSWTWLDGGPRCSSLKQH